MAEVGSEVDLDCQKLIPSEVVIQQVLPISRSRSGSTSSAGRTSRSQIIQEGPGGQLSFEMGKNNLSTLDENLFYRKLNLNSQELVALGEALKRFKLICELDISNNKITRLGKEMRELKNLTYLNASHNKLTKAFDFDAESVLTEVDFSNNKIEDIDKAGKQKSLRRLNLRSNHITDVRGLGPCKQLQNLNLSHNEMRSADGLEKLPLFHLDLSDNKMESIEGCSNLPNLLNLDLSNNHIENIDLFNKSSSPIQSLNLAGNRLSKIGHILPLQKLKFLHHLDLRNNPLANIDDYRELVIFLLPKLTKLDGVAVTPEDTVQASNLFQPNSDLCAALDHMTHTVYGILEGDRIRHYTLPGPEHIYPFLVLAAPKGLKTGSIVSSICSEFESTFGHAISHSTAHLPSTPASPKSTGGSFEKTSFGYHYVTHDEFQEEIRRGKFLQMTRHRNGQMYGLTKDALEAVAVEEKAALTHMNLDGIRSMKLTQLQPRYVLIIPNNDSVYDNMVKDMPNDIREMALAEYSELKEVNKNNPGYFDIVIPVESAEKAVESVRDLVKDFLGTPGSTPSVTSRKDSRGSISISSSRSRQRRAELLLESVRHPSNSIPIQIKSAPEFRSKGDGLLGELLDQNDITVIDNGDQTSEEEWSSNRNSLNHTPVLPPITPR